MTPRQSFSDVALGVCYLASAAIMLSIYRAPVRDAVREMVAAMPRARFVNIRSQRGKLWDDVRDAVKDSDIE